MRKLWMILLTLAVAAGGLAWLFAATRPEWTTGSAAALAEYQKGREAQMKFYFTDAQAAYERALKLDPNFVAAKIALLDGDKSKEDRRALVEELRAVDRSRLNPRERLMIDVVLARVDGDEAGRAQRIEEFLLEHPRDPWALMIASNDAWSRQDLPTAEQRYRELLEVDPNWLVARNHLGYIAMARGQFDEAEEYFRTYKYVAPDQANPHDSLGELLVLLGRFDEARLELEEALRVRPDFCASYGNLLRAALLERDFASLPDIVERAEAHCDPRTATELFCDGAMARALVTGDYAAPYRDLAERCGKRFDEPTPLGFDLALHTGREAEARAMEEKIRQVREKEGVGAAAKHRQGIVLDYMTATRAMFEGRYAEGARLLRQVDEASNWWEGNGGGVFRLIVRAKLVQALERAGESEAAARELEALRKLNPAAAEWASALDFGPPAAGRPAA